MKMFFSSTGVRPFIRPFVGLGLATCLPVIETYFFNIDQLPFSDVLIPLAVAIFGTLLCFALFFLVLRSVLKAELICYLVIAFVWLYPSYSSFVEAIALYFDFSLSFRFGLTLIILNWGLLFVLGCLFVYRRAQILMPFVFVFPFAILLAYGGVVFSTYAKPSASIFRQTESEYMPEDLSNAFASISSTNSTEQLPDIYFIILDGYARQDTLQEYYNFDNSQFLQELKELGFIIPANSYSNYGQTFTSLAATLNLRYLNDLGLTGIDRTVPIRMQQKAFVADFLRKQGYKIVSISGDLAQNNADFFSIEEGPFSVSAELAIILLEKTVFFPFLRKFFPEHLTRAMIDQLNFLKNSYEFEGRKFIFANLNLPHPPYVFDKDGNVRTDTSLSLTSGWDNVEGYTGQLQFTNKVLLPILKEIITQSPIKPVIFLQADHGPWPVLEKIDDRWSILNAVYLQGEQVADVPTTPVNNFRYIFKKYFDAPIELLPNKMYYSTYEEPYKFFDITEMLLQERDIYVKDLILEEPDNKSQ